jgi:hypothetical protein
MAPRGSKNKTSWQLTPLARSAPSLARGVGLLAKVLERFPGATLKQLAERIGNAASYVEVGLLNGTASPEVIERAFYHEFGTEHLPERSFIRFTMARKKEKYARLMKKLAQRVADGKMGVKEAMEWIGDEIAADMQARIQSNIRPHLKEETVNRKKRELYTRPNIALIATGEMIESLARRFHGRK